MENMINKQVEEFQVSAFCKGEFLDVTQEDLKGHWSILFFYPADFTFVCPTELGDLADHYEEFKEEGCEIYSVSEDTHFVHKAWADASDTIKKIQYVMLGDPAGVLAKQFGVLVEELGQVINKLRSSGVTILLAEQNVNFALAVSSDCYLIEKGKVVYHGAAKEIPKEIFSQYLGL